MIFKGCFLALSLVTLAACTDDPLPLEAVVNQLSQKLSDVQAQLAALDTKQTQLETRFGGSQRKVAFLAYNNKDPFTVSSSGIMGYNTATINEGNGFNPLSGVFTSPVSGVYVFFINCMSATGAGAGYSVMVNGSRTCECYSYSPAHAEHGAAMTTVHMAAGQKAWVDGPHSSSTRGHFWNTFAGFLLNTED